MLRIRRWVSYHGVALNVEPELTHFDGIVPCGIRGHGVTSLVDLGLPVTLSDADLALKETFEEVFERSTTCGDGVSAIKSGPRAPRAEAAGPPAPPEQPKAGR